MKKLSFEKAPPASTPAHLVPPIIFEDQHVIVIDKPAGLLSQGEHRGDPNVVDWLRILLNRPFVGLVHRLDRNTSGIMVIAKRSKSAQRLTDALQEGQMRRSYLAWIYGRLEREVRWSHRLFKDTTKNIVRVVSHAHPQGKDAALTVRPDAYGVWSGSLLTLAHFELETGRSHQIRVQAAHEGYGILGDLKYGGTQSGIQEFSRPALHSFELSFPHPISGEVMTFQAPLPKDMADIQKTGEARILSETK